ncbi:hypothetical protein Tco_0208430, partial [Tanacetum coccineum]
VGVSTSLFLSQLLVGDHSRSLHHQTNVHALRGWNHPTSDSQLEIILEPQGCQLTHIECQISSKP